MKISASIYSNKSMPLDQLVSELDACKIDMFHVDCNDDPKVFDDIATIRTISKTPIDLHIISDSPEQFFELLEKQPLDYVAFQYENLTSPLNWPSLPDTKMGLAITSDTPVSVFEQFENHFDFILIMTTTPGQSGGTFRKDNFQKIRQFREQFPACAIHVDGGVNDEVGFILRTMGVQSVVSGSYLVKHESIATALLHLRSSIVHSDFRVEDFMMDLQTAPILPTKDASVASVLQVVEDYKLGCCILTDENGRLAGICTNADIRRGFLKHQSDFSQLQVADLINTSPTTINGERTISDLLELIKSKSFLISFLPVLDADQKVAGAISFINLIKSES